MEYQFKQGMTAPDWEMDDYGWYAVCPGFCLLLLGRQPAYTVPLADMPDKMSHDCSLGRAAVNSIYLQQTSAWHVQEANFLPSQQPAAARQAGVFKAAY